MRGRKRSIRNCRGIDWDNNGHDKAQKAQKRISLNQLFARLVLFCG